MLIMHGDQDNQVPVNQSLELEGAYQKQKLKVQLEIVHGAGHSGDPYFEPKNQRIMELFLSEALMK
jgi:dipeptidyl aminopeptidase/acylaminoacyl peptidase